MMTATEIRKQMVVNGTAKTERQSLALAASRLLGYGRLAQDEAVGSLAQVLGTLDISPLNQADAEKYMEDALEKKRRNVFGRVRDNPEYNWKTYWLNEYRKPIPEFVL